MAFKTQQEIEARAPELLAREVAEAETDHRARASKALKLVTGVIAERPDVRFADGRKLLAIRATEPGRDKPMSGVYFAPPHELAAGFGREGFDERVAALEVGSQVSMAGTWSKRRWEDGRGVSRETWEFQAQFIEGGRLSVDDMVARAAARIDAFRPQRAASPDVARDRPAGRPPASPDLSYASGNIVDDGAQVLVNTVNSQLSEYGNPVMGKGVALAFKERFPSIMKDYADAIRSGELKPGRALLFDLPDGRKWAALATKDFFKDPSREEWVESGLKELGEKMRAAGLTSVALPPPGCGNGGLDWRRVEPMVHEYLGRGGIRIAMYAKPSGAMEPAQGVAAQPGQRSQGDDGKARALAAFGGGQSAAAGAREWTKSGLLAAIPSLLRQADGYSPYAGIGSRETPQDVCDDMTAMAGVLERRGFTLRSGFAGGADTAFELGTTRDDRREIFAPWKGFGANPDSPKEKQRWDQIRRHEALTGECFMPATPILLDAATAKRAEEMAARFHPAWEKLGSGPRALMSRNGAQALGRDLDAPARFEIAYTVDGNATGGTGQAIRMAHSYGIPVLNMHDPDIRAAVLAELGIARERSQHREWEAAMTAAIADGPMRRPSPGEFDLTVPPVRSRAKADVESFCKVADRNGIMSNMAHTPLKVGDVVYSSSEALYQALRFPDHPELQRRIAAERAYPSKILAHENKHLTRPDWNEVNVAAMAYAVTVKRDQVPAFREALEATQGRDIVELSVKDDFWGAKPQGDRLVGRDVLGSILTQSRDGARMDEPPPGSSLPGVGERERPAGKEVERPVLPDPALKASMYFRYGSDRREGFKSETTFDAILAGERTSTTRYKEWGPTERWEKLPRGSVVRFYEDKEMRGRSVDVVVLGTERIRLRDLDEKGLDEWSRVEGWSVEHGRASARKYSEGVQIRYALPDSPEGRAALGLEPSRDASPRQEASRDVRPLTPEGQAWGARPSAATRAAMSDKERALSLF